MTKEEYYKISREQKLPLRCPCLSSCARYRYTAYLIGRTSYKPRSQNGEKAMQEMGILSQEDNIKNMLDAGEPVTLIGGSRSFGIYNACPEFFLHPHSHKLPGMKNLAVHQYSFDEEYRGDKFIPGESMHYTECAEYALYISKKGKSKNRKGVPVKLRAELQKEINSQCPFCFDKHVGHFQVHHIDENPENNKHENLLMLCPNCHSKITKGDILLERVKEMKRTLLHDSSLIECVSINIDTSNCSWRNYEEPNAFYDDRNEKSRFPLLQFSLINNSDKTILLTDIELKAEYLSNGMSGVPMSYKLESLATYRLLLPLENEVTKLKLDNEVVVTQGQAIKFTTEIYASWDGENYPPDGRVVLYFTFKFGNAVSISAPKIFLNCINEDSTLKIYHLR